MKTVRRFRSKRVSGSVIHGDSLEFLRSLAGESAGIVFLDPPFNLGKQYSLARPKLDKKQDDAYERWMKEVLDECVRILKPGAALYLYHIPRWAILFGQYLSTRLQFRHWIAISMKNGFVRGRNLYPAHYSLLYFTKGPHARFRRPKTSPLKCRHCGKLVKDYGGYTEIIKRKGINLSDVWDDVSPVRHKSRKFRKANELPMIIMSRIIEISGGSKVLYVDPFAGTGTGIIAALDSGLQFKACDIVLDNCNIIADRVEKWKIQSEGRGNGEG